MTVLYISLYIFFYIYIRTKYFLELLNDYYKSDPLFSILDDKPLAIFVFTIFFCPFFFDVAIIFSLIHDLFHKLKKNDI